MLRSVQAKRKSQRTCRQFEHALSFFSVWSRKGSSLERGDKRPTGQSNGLYLWALSQRANCMTNTGCNLGLLRAQGGGGRHSPWAISLSVDVLVWVVEGVHWERPFSGIWTFFLATLLLTELAGSSRVPHSLLSFPSLSLCSLLPFRYVEMKERDCKEQNSVSTQTFGETFYLNHFRACVDDFITLRYLEESDFDISVVWSLPKFLDLISQLTCKKKTLKKTLKVIKAVEDNCGPLFAQRWTVRTACWSTVLGQLNKTITCSFRTVRVRVSAAAGAESPM